MPLKKKPKKVKKIKKIKKNKKTVRQPRVANQRYNEGTDYKPSNNQSIVIHNHLSQPKRMGLEYNIFSSKNKSGVDVSGNTSGYLHQLLDRLVENPNIQRVPLRETVVRQEPATPPRPTPQRPPPPIPPPVEDPPRDQRGAKKRPDYTNIVDYDKMKKDQLITLLEGLGFKATKAMNLQTLREMVEDYMASEDYVASN